MSPSCVSYLSSPGSWICSYKSPRPSLSPGVIGTSGSRDRVFRRVKVRGWLTTWVDGVDTPENRVVTERVESWARAVSFPVRTLTPWKTQRKVWVAFSFRRTYVVVDGRLLGQNFFVCEITKPWLYFILVRSTNDRSRIGKDTRTRLVQK